jgi:hypothetical protein
MSQHISRSTSNRTALVPQKKQHDPLEFPDRTVFIRREKQEDFPEMKFITGKAYGVYKQNGKQNGRLITLYGGLRTRLKELQATATFPSGCTDPLSCKTNKTANPGRLLRW